MKIGQPDWPLLDEPVVVEYDGWHAVWHGGEYINLFIDAEGARLAVDGLNTTGHSAGHAINTTGDELDNFADAEAYVLGQLREWADEDGDTYRANGFG